MLALSCAIALHCIALHCIVLLDGMVIARGHCMQVTENDIAFFFSLGCAIALHYIALHCIVVYCIADLGIYFMLTRSMYRKVGDICTCISVYVCCSCSCNYSCSFSCSWISKIAIALLLS